MKESEKEMIARRSRNADAIFAALINVDDILTTLSLIGAAVLGVVILLVVWLS